MGKKIGFLALFLGLGAIALAQVEGPSSCQFCGMDRTAFAQSRMLIIYADGTTVGICSLNCAVIEMKQNPKKKVKALMVGDYRTEKLLDARAATWVIGGKFPGVMTQVAKWAFDTRSAAEQFISENGGKLASFDECLALALQEH
jgi:nitrous oxide reductase accessory protein NosL